MNFDLDEEQGLLKDSVDRLLADHYGFEQRNAHRAAEEGWSRAMWARFADLGLLALGLPEAHGGYGGPVERMIAMEAFGGALVVEPYLATIVLGGGVLKRAGEDVQARLIPDLIAGNLLLAFAHHERGARHDLAHVATRAARDGAGFVLDGEKSLVLHGDSADRLVVSARVEGEIRDRDGIALFLIPAEASGIARRGYPTQDGQRAAEVSLDGVRVGPEALLVGPEAGLPVIETVVDEGVAALAAEAVGAMGAMHALTVDYLKTRKQFGVAIGSFQALQHRAVDMLIALEQARSMALFATMMVDDPDPVERGRAMSAAKVQVGRSGRAVGQGAVQLHGGIGVTMEYRVGHLFKRVTMIDTVFGDADHHLARLAEAGGLAAA